MSTTWLDLQGWAGIKVRCRRDSGFLHFVFWLPVLLSLGVCSLCGGASHSVPVTTHTVVMRAKWNFLKLKLKKGSLLEAFQHLFGDIWWPNLWKEDWIYNFFIMTVHLREPSWQLLFNIMLKFCHYISDPGAELLMAWLLFSNKQSVLFSSLAPWRLSLPHTGSLSLAQRHQSWSRTWWLITNSVQMNQASAQCSWSIAWIILTRARASVVLLCSLPA